MSEAWGVSSLSPASSSVFHWKIENFDRMLKSYGKIGFESPSFNVASDGGFQQVQLRLTKISRVVHKSSHSSNKSPDCSRDSGSSSFMDHGYDITRLMDDGIIHPLEHFALIEVKVVGGPKNILLSGKIEFHNIDSGKTVVGTLGDPGKAEFDDCRVFANKNSKIQIDNTKGKNYSCEGFCVSKATHVINMKVILSTPGVVTNSVSLVPSDQTVKEVGSARLVSDLRLLLTNASEYADFTIVCEGEKFHCNEAILRVRSPVLNKMFQQKMKESTTRELKLDDVSRGTIRAFLEYIYTGEVKESSVDDYSELIFMADKYHVPGLLELCFHKLPEIEDDKVLNILILADRHNLEKFKNVAMQRIIKDKQKFLKNEDFATKINQVPSILMDFFQL